ncbi:MmcQ/YjbR family DNA-binding protein [Levilactobacillus fuyuanensis]|uniref:MmcQ/YjbR family DNA-binding protein n=1 Tax=Levilactobacillus fuyuanensis TaxID=2486022 RepID=A0ABW4H364_9LACO|nr:MmcQ/YjbR family DNA-binding protein [Levilactobacillus fuyuanensis]
MKITKEELIKLSSHDKAVSVDRPFNAPGRRNQIIFDALRHQDSKKIFGLVYEKDDTLYIDLKCDSRNIDELVSAFPYILPGQHFTKQHWITLDIPRLPSRDELAKLVDASYRLTD